MLKVYDEYVNSEKVAYFQLIYKALSDCADAGFCFTLGLRELSWELIGFYRGIVYNYLVSDRHFDLHEVGMERMRRYFHCFLQ